MFEPRLRIGVVGYCPPTKFDESKALIFIKDAFDKLEKLYNGHEKSVVSGLTNVGIPRLAYEEAKRRNWETVGIACKKTDEYERFPVDLEIVTGENWGDESPRFLRSIDVLVRVGGGKQALDETNEAKKRGKIVLECELEALS